MEDCQVEDRRDKSNIIGSGIIIYQTDDGQTKIDVKFEDDTVWLTQAQNLSPVEEEYLESIKNFHSTIKKNGKT